jgi:hypothetical protein
MLYVALGSSENCLHRNIGFFGLAISYRRKNCTMLRE